MVNFLIQHSKNKYDFREDDTYNLLNHFNYKHFSFYNEHYRFDFLQHSQDKEKRFISDNEIVLFYLGNILFKNEEYNTIHQLKKLYSDGSNIVDKIESGRYIIVIFDKVRNKLTIINDRFSFIPYFIYNDRKNFVISTEPKGIIKSILLKEKMFILNYAAVANYFKYGYILGNKYFLEEIIKQNPAIIFSFNGSKMMFKKYWRFKPTFNEKINNKILFKLLKTFQDGLKKNQEKYQGNYICDISGGYDSRFIYLNKDDINYVMTVGDEDCEEYSLVIDTLKLKPAKLIHVKPKLTKEKILETLNLTDLTGDFVSAANRNTVQSYKKAGISFEYGYNGFLGDAILGGEYLNIKKEILREFKIFRAYSFDDFKIDNFNERLLSKTFSKCINETNDFINYVNENEVKEQNDMQNRKKLILFKLRNRGLNHINANGILLGYKFMNKFFPFFYYPFFDLYTKIDLDDLHLRKTYTSLFKKIDKKYCELKDTHFKVAFSFPFKFRLLIRIFYTIILNQKFIRIKNKKMITPADDFMKNDQLIDFFKNKLTDTRYKKFFNQSYIQTLFRNQILLKKNFSFLQRCIGFILFLEKYNNKIDW